MKPKIGVYVNGMLVLEYSYDDYDRALKDAEYAYGETGIPHEIKFISVREND